MKKLLLLLILANLCFAFQSKKDTSGFKLTVNAVRINEPIVLDGILSEKVWNNGYGISGFKQRDPNEGAEASEKTIVHVAYDDDAVYIGAKMFDAFPDSITKRLSRKDNWLDSDIFYFYVDPYNDKRTGYYFGVNAAGTLFDGILYNDSWNDDSWDGVWEGKATTNGEGWFAEFRIPYSQLRFHKDSKYTWGINFKREIERKKEQDYLVYVPKKESGFVSRFADLKGIENIPLPTNTEIIPYITGKAEYLHFDRNDPFNKRSNYSPGIGADIKLGITSNLTLNATINPDFGQVEVDPAVVNLSDVETYFQEKRPFFIEGSSIFEFGFGGANNYWGFNWPGPSFFYSRRLGRNPQCVPDNDYSKVPDGTHILGAGKLTGKVAGNWNIGALTALTQREFAEVEYESVRTKPEVEPLTSYNVLRMQSDFNDGKQGIGFMSTHTQRFFKDARLEDDLNRSGTMFGVDGWTFLDSDKEWVLTGWAAGSHVTGTKTQITDLQRNSVHYLQRPDANSFSVDSNATSLSGYAARLYLNKQKGNVFINNAIGIISPRFDVNDLGFMSRTDAINMHFGGGYKWTEPTTWYRYIELGGAIFRNYDYDKNITWEGIYHFGFLRYLNYYTISWNLAYNPQTINSRRTRGGPLSINEPGWQANYYVNSDSRKKWVFGQGFYTYRTKHSTENDYSFYVEFRPAANITIKIEPEYTYFTTGTQWVDSFDDTYASATYGKRYVFADMKQETFSAGIRLNWTFTPELSLQMYMQPLISAGNYSNFKELARPKSYDFNVFGTNGSVVYDSTTTYHIDPDGNGPADQFSFDQPDFNFKSLRGNAVLRWEYQPGSVFYFVWTQTRSHDEDTGEFRFGRSFDRLVNNTTVNNIFMVKFTYWLNM